MPGVSLLMTIKSDNVLFLSQDFLFVLIRLMTLKSLSFAEEVAGIDNWYEFPNKSHTLTSQQVEWCPNENWKITIPSEKIYQTFGPVRFKSYQTDRILTRHCLSDWHKVALCDHV